MIPSSELRIGNKAFVKTSVVSLHRISQSEVVVDFGEDAEYEIMTPDDISPIPLSGEVLKACGFEKHSNSNEFWTFWQLPSGWHIAESHHDESSAGVKKGLFYWEEYYHEVKYLHKLMNLYFEMTGKELNYQP